MRPKFPPSVTLLVWLVLSFTVWHATRLATSLAWHDVLETYAARPGTLYIGLTGALWLCVGTFLLWSIGRRAPWTRRALLAGAVLYAAWVWMDRLLVQAQARANWPFALLLTVLLLAYVTAVVLHPKNQTYFERETHERESKNRPTA
jgi:hypothetical protein